MTFLHPFLEGFGLGASLLVAIGAQNAYVLRLGLKRHHVFLAAAFCALSDLILIAAGVFGLGALVREQAWFLTLITWGGVGFLSWFGARAAVRAWNPGTLEAGAETPPQSVATVLASLTAFTFLNPHVYLDTVLLLGGLGARHPAPLQPWFVLGAALSSLAWFFALAYGARLLVPLFHRPVTWRILDGVIAAVMFLLAGGLLAGGLGPPDPGFLDGKGRVETRLVQDRRSV